MFKKLKNKKRSLVTTMFISLVLVATLTSLANTFTGLVDIYCIQTFFNKGGAAGYSMTSPITQITYGIASLIAIGSQVVITKHLASGRQDKAREAFVFGFLFSLGLGIILGLLGFFGSDYVSILLGARKADPDLSLNIFNSCSKYLMGYSIGLPFLFLNEFLMPMVYIDNDKKTATASIIVTIIVNSTLDIVLSYYIDSTIAVSLAVAIGYFCSSFVLFTHFLRKNSNFKVNFKLFNFKQAPSIIVAGSSTGVKNLVITARVFVLNFLYLAIGGASSAIVLSAKGIEGSVSNLFCCGVGGLISTVITLGAMFYNEEDEKSLNELVKHIIRFCLIVGGSLTIIYFFSAEAIARLYHVAEGEEFKQTVMAMRCESLTIMFSTFNTAMLAFFQGSKKHLWAYFCTFMQSFILQIVFVVVLGFTIGIKGIWIGTALGFMFYPLIHLTIATIKARRFPRNAKELFFLNKNFGYKDEHTIEFSVTSIADTFDIVNKVLATTTTWNIDKTRRQHVASCAEELALLIVLSGFSKDKKHHQLDIRILYNPNTDLVMVRTRDDCQKFNVNTISEKLNDMGKVGNIALKIVVNMSEDIEYNRVLKMNNLIVKF